MKGIIRTGDGGPEVLQLAEAPSPTPTATQLLVDVHATALNRADMIQRRGGYPPPPGESNILGLEIAGTVSAMGDAVEGGISKGDRVFGLVGGGGYAEQAVIDYRMAMPIPDGWSFEQAAAVPEVFFTANENIFTLGRLSAGEGDSDSCRWERGRQYWGSDFAACGCYCLCYCGGHQRRLTNVRHSVQWMVLTTKHPISLPKSNA